MKAALVLMDIEPLLLVQVNASFLMGVGGVQASRMLLFSRPSYPDPRKQAATLMGLWWAFEDP